MYDICFTGAVTVNDAAVVGAAVDFESKDKPPAKEVDADVTLVVAARGKPVAPVVAAEAWGVPNEKPVVLVAAEELAWLVVGVAPNEKPVAPLDGWDKAVAALVVTADWAVDTPPKVNPPAGFGVWELLVAALNENPVVCNVEPDLDTANPPPNASPDVEDGADIANEPNENPEAVDVVVVVTDVAGAEPKLNPLAAEVAAVAAGLAPAPAPNENPDTAAVGFTAAGPPKLKAVAELPGAAAPKLNPEVELAVAVVALPPKLNPDPPLNPIFPADDETGVPPKLKPVDALEAGAGAPKENPVAVDWDVVVDAPNADGWDLVVDAPNENPVDWPWVDVFGAPKLKPEFPDEPKLNAIFFIIKYVNLKYQKQNISGCKITIDNSKLLYHRKTAPNW